MHFDPLAVSLDLINNNIHFSGSLRDHAPIDVDYTPPIGDGQGYTSLELFLVSLSTCLGTSVLLLLRKMQKTVTGCRIQARGARREKHPTCFQRIDIEIVVQSPDAQDCDLQRALHLSETSLCPVWAMIKGNVEVCTTYRILCESELDTV